MCPWRCPGEAALVLFFLLCSSALAALRSLLSACLLCLELPCCLDCVRFPGLWFTFFHEFGKFSATIFPNRLSSCFFMSSWNSDLYLIALPTRSCLLFLVFSLSLQTKVSPWLCSSFHEFSYSFLNMSVVCFFQLQGLFFSLWSPFLFFFSQDCRVLFTSEAHLTVKVCAVCLAFTVSALVCCWGLADGSLLWVWSMLVFETLFRNSFKLHSTEESYFPEPALGSQAPFSPSSG